MFFTFNSTSGKGTVLGKGWNLKYEGFTSGIEAWFAVQADGFCLAPGTSLGVNSDRWTAKVVRA